MKFKNLQPAAVLFLLTSSMLAADKNILFEFRVPKTVEVGHGSIEFVGEHTSQGYQLMQMKQKVDGNTTSFNILSLFTVPCIQSADSPLLFGQTLPRKCWPKCFHCP